jgi:hypothetical protein
VVVYSVMYSGSLWDHPAWWLQAACCLAHAGWHMPFLDGMQLTQPWLSMRAGVLAGCKVLFSANAVYTRAALGRSGGTDQALTAARNDWCRSGAVGAALLAGYLTAAWSFKDKLSYDRSAQDQLVLTLQRTWCYYPLLSQ